MALRSQLVLFAGLVALFVLACLSAVYGVLAQRMLDAEARFEAQGVATDLAAVREGSDRQDAAELQRALDRFVDRSTDVAYVLVVEEPSGRVLAGVPHVLANGAELVPPEIVATARSSSRVVETRLLADAACGARKGEAVMDASERMLGPRGTVRGTLRVGVRVARVDGLLMDSLPLAGGVTVVVFALAIGLASVQAKAITRPVQSLATSMERVAKGDLETEAEEQGPSELRALAAAYNGMLVGLRQKLALERYVPTRVRDELDVSGGTAIVEGKLARAVVLFADLRGFSALAEKRSPTDVLALLNRYSDAMSNVVSAHGGDVIELMGDGILAVFVDEEASAKSAISCALAMTLALERLDVSGLRMGVGLHAGDVVLGTVGTGARLKFAVVGDPVNVSSRIQEQARDPSRSMVLVSDEVRELARDGFAFRAIGELEVRGRQGSVKLWEVAPNEAA